MMNPKIITLLIAILGVGFWSYIWLSRLERIIKNDVFITLKKLNARHN